MAAINLIDWEIRPHPAGRDDQYLTIGETGKTLNLEEVLVEILGEMIARVMEGDTLVPADVLYPPAMIATAMQITAQRFAYDAPVLGTYILDATLITPENAADYYFPDSPF